MASGFSSVASTSAVRPGPSGDPGPDGATDTPSIRPCWHVVTGATAQAADLNDVSPFGVTSNVPGHEGSR